MILHGDNILRSPGKYVLVFCNRVPAVKWRALLALAMAVEVVIHRIRVAFVMSRAMIMDCLVKNFDFLILIVDDIVQIYDLLILRFNCRTTVIDLLHLSINFKTSIVDFCILFFYPALLTRHGLLSSVQPRCPNLNSSVCF